VPRMLIALVISAALLVAGCGSSSKDNSTAAAPAATTAAATTPAAPSGNAGAVAISMKNISFSPKSVTVKVGQTVTWTNDDSVDHNVTADNNEFSASDNFGKGKTFSYKPTKAGTIKYNCTIHPGMEGTLIVQ
jgi:plastocyanin